jgi:DNA-binding CsgD family transcriptional regulator
MVGGAPSDLATRGEDALARGDWPAAVELFELALRGADEPELHDGLGRALWWLRDVDRAIAEREAAYVAFRKRGDDAKAVPIALWLAREYLEALGNEPVSRGWLARAEGIVAELPTGPANGWFSLTRGRLAPDPATAIDDAVAAVTIGREARDADLEATALALRGLAEIARGDVETGMTSLDEAMVAATAGEVADPVVFGDVCCLVTRAAEEAGDASRLERWTEVTLAFMQRTGHPPLLEFCGTCCAEVLLGNGELTEAEGWLTRTISELEGRGHHARCVHPAAKLAELRLLQGRIEEAERLLEGLEDRPDALRAVAAVRLARGDTAVASALLHRRLAQVAEGSLLGAPLLALLVDVQLAQGDRAAAAATATRLKSLAGGTTWPRTHALADLVAGRTETDDDRARELLGSATAAYDRLRMPLDAARARLALAEVSAEAQPEVALHEARLAFESFDGAGATALADRAAAVVRALGGPARTGPKAIGLLTKREREVLALLGEGLTNAEVAARLYISTKTAEHHVGNVLSKLHLRGRAGAAAFAQRHAAALPDPISAHR